MSERFPGWSRERIIQYVFDLEAAENAKASVFDGTACAEEVEAGNGNCGMCVKCLRLKLDALKAKADGLAEALNELRSCSRAKIGMEDDFACADKQMRDALTAYSETKP